MPKSANKPEQCFLRGRMFSQSSSGFKNSNGAINVATFGKPVKKFMSEFFCRLLKQNTCEDNACSLRSFSVRRSSLSSRRSSSSFLVRDSSSLISPVYFDQKTVVPTVHFLRVFYDLTGNARRINRRLLLWFIRTRHTCGCFQREIQRSRSRR